MFLKSKKNLLLLTCLISLSTLSLLFFLISPYINKIIIDDAIKEANQNLLLFSVVLFAALNIVGEVFRTISKVILTYLESRISLDFKQKIHRKVRKFKILSYFSEGELLSYNMNDVNMAKQHFRIIHDVFFNSLQVVLTLAIIIVIQWEFLFYIIPVLIIYAIMPLIIGRKLTKESLILQRRLSDISDQLSRSYYLSKEIRFFNKEVWDQTRIDLALRGEIKPIVKIEIFRGFYSGGLIFYSLFLCYLLYSGGMSVISGSLTLGTLLSLISYTGFLAQPIYEIVNRLSLSRSVKASKERIKILLEKPERKLGDLFLDQNRAFNIQLNNVSLIKNNHYILKNMSYEIKSGSFIGIVGESGSGKTSLFNLLARLDECTKGNIEVQGKLIENIDYSNYYSHIKYVTQESNFVEGSLRDNLFIENEENLDLETLKYLTMEFGLNFFGDNILDFKIEKQGGNLSGGQKQRLAIIRSLIYNPSILLLDEATSALDYHTERKVLSLIKKIRKGKTTIFISHNIELLEDADKIIVFDKGEMVLVGNEEYIRTKLLIPKHSNTKSEVL
ncbi:ABC transporter ATP-binding protein [Cytobacillus kochii]|nr:ABC transporter ATP-binding protein [Cytobacillus kochii]